MKATQKILAIVLVVLLGATAYALFQTAEPPKMPASSAKGRLSAPEGPLVDQTALQTARRLAQLATTDEEQPFVKEALRLADKEVDTAYDAALRDARQNPQALNADAKAAKERVEKAQKLIAADEARIAQLKDLIAKTKDPDRKEKLQEQYDGVEADRELAQDEMDEAQGDFRIQGGDLAARIAEEKKQHENTDHSTAQGQHAVPASDQFGLVHRYQQWKQLHDLQMELWQGRQEAENRVATLTLKHNALETTLEAEKEKSPELAHHSKKKKALSPAASGGAINDDRSAEELAAATDRTWQLAAQQEDLSSYDSRIETNKQLSDVYAKWIDLVALRQRAVVHRALNGVLIILSILLVGLYFMTVVDHVLGRLNMDRRQLQNLRGVSHVALRVAGLLFILLVIMGPPGQLGTFLGLAGAGLTVALKDFIVGFFGWFVLMGKNGIRLGDWVEINGVTGEVVELGMFHTVLLETGNWTDTGHPTGRRVTFTNSFAIEGHYFNFSTSGQWLWDELQIVLPAGQDPYPVVAAIQKEVASATAESAKQAEQEWQRAAGSRDMKSLTAAPAINVKQVVGGIEIAVRYITRANERYQMRAKLYQAAVQLLGGGKNAPSTTAP